MGILDAPAFSPAQAQAVRSASPLPTAAYDTFATNGDLTAAPSGQTYTQTSSNAGGNGAAVVGGYLTAKAPSSGSTNAAYVQVDLGATVTNCSVEFTLDQAGQSVAVISKTVSRIVTGDNWFHFEVNNGSWGITYVGTVNGSPGLVPFKRADGSDTAGAFAKPLVVGDGTIYRLKFSIKGNRCDAILPDGTTVSFTDTHISANVGRYLVLEPIYNAGSVATRFKSFQAGAATATYTAPWPETADLTQAIAAITPGLATRVYLGSNVQAPDTNIVYLTALQQVLRANTPYYIRGQILYYSANTAADMLFAGTINGQSPAMPAGAWYSLKGLGSSSTAVGNASLNMSVSDLNAPVTLKTFGGTAGRVAAAFESYVTTNASGYYIPAFAQATSSSGNAVIIAAGSYLEYIKLS